MFSPLSRIPHSCGDVTLSVNVDLYSAVTVIDQYM